MSIAFLGFLTGVAAYAAGVQVLAGLRGERRLVHLSMAALAATAAVYTLLSLAIRLQTDLAVTADLVQWQGFVTFLFATAVYAFVGWYTDVRPWWVAVLITVALLGAAVASLWDPYGPFYGSLVGIQTHRLPWGELIRLPVGRPEPHIWAYGIVLWAPLAFVGYALVRQFRRGERVRAVLLGVTLLLAATAGLVDMFVVTTTTYWFPWLETSFLLFLVVVSLRLTDEMASLARVRRDLAHRERHLRSLLDAAPYGIVILDPVGGRVVDLNTRARTLCGLEGVPLPVDIARTRVWPLAEDGESGGRVGSLLERTLQGETPVAEWSITDPAGQAQILEVRLAAIQGREGTPLIRASLIDVTDRKRAEAHAHELQEQLHHAQKLDTIGTLAGGMAHDFNNLLTPILGLSEVALARDGGSMPEDDVSTVRTAALRARDLVRQLLTFSRRAPVADEVVHITDAVKQATRLFEATLPARITLSRRFTAGDVLVPLGATRVQQVVMNLCTNAAQAMPDGGELSVHLACEDAPAGEEAPRVVLEVTDTGSGMGPETVSRIFDPFFTTKADSDGTGLGLSVVHGIVTGSGGEIQVDSEPGRGTTFRVLFPTTTAQPTALERPRAEPWRPSGRALIVDDNPVTLDSLIEMVRLERFDVVGEATVAGALERLQGPQPFSLVLVDFDMPDGDGALIARTVRGQRPGVPVVCVTGVTLDEKVEPVFDAVLLKPPSLAELQTLIQGLVSGDWALRSGRGQQTAPRS